MQVAFSWIYVLQMMILILFISLNIIVIIHVAQRRRPVRVLVHSPHQSWAEIRKEIEERTPGKIEWKPTP